MDLFEHDGRAVTDLAQARVAYPQPGGDPSTPLAGGTAAPPSWGTVGRFISVTQVGDAASVQLSFDLASNTSSGWIDFHNLVRINGVWKITNKTATHSSR